MEERKTFYEHIESNKIKSVFLIAIVISFIIFLGYVIGLIWFTPAVGLTIAVIVGIIFSLIGYYSGDSLVLSITGAKEVKKQDYPYLYNTVEGLSLAAGLPVPKVYVIDDPNPNAFATGRDPKHASIAVTTSLLDTMNRSELEGVLAHEMSHVGNYDVRFMLLTTVLVGIVVILANFLLRSLFYSGGGRDDRGGGNLKLVLIIVGIVFAILSPIFAQLITLAVSRKREYLADATASKLTRNPSGLAGALKKLKDHKVTKSRMNNNATNHLYINNPFKNASSWFSTHPDINDRIKRLETM